MGQHLKLDKHTGVIVTDAFAYRQLIGRLIYLTPPQPDLAYVVHALSQYLESPK